MTTPDTRLVSATSIPSVARHAIQLITPQPVASVSDEDYLIDDLAFDSLTLVELAFALEDLFGIDAVTPERAMTLRTVGDIIGYIEEGIASGSAQLPSAEAVHALSAQYGHTWTPDD